MKFLSLYLLILFSITTGADTLQGLLSARLKEGGLEPKFELERTWTLSGYVPVSFVEYRYGRSSDNEVATRRDDENQRYFRVPFSDDGGESHTFRIHFKSFAEIVGAEDSRKLSGQLIDAEKLELTNQRQFNVYMELVEDSLQSRMQKVLGARDAELQKSLNGSGESLGMAKINVRDLVREMERLQKVDSEFAGVRAQKSPYAALSEKQAEEISRHLLDAVGPLAKKLSETKWKEEKLQIERKRIELKLSRLGRELSWAKDRKLIDHLDLQRDTLDREDSIRIGFNIPFLRFDNEDRARDKAMLAAKESELRRDEVTLQTELRRKLLEVLSLAAQVESMKGRLARTRGVSGKVRHVQDIELRAVLGDFTFELERDVVLFTLKFYVKYLEYLRDQGGFAAFASVNLLDPQWTELKP